MLSASASLPIHLQTQVDHLKDTHLLLSFDSCTNSGESTITLCRWLTYCTVMLVAQSGSTDAIQSLQIWNQARLRLVPSNDSDRWRGRQIILGCCT